MASLAPISRKSRGKDENCRGAIVALTIYYVHAVMDVEDASLQSQRDDLCQPADGLLQQTVATTPAAGELVFILFQGPTDTMLYIAILCAVRPWATKTVHVVAV